MLVVRESHTKQRSRSSTDSGCATTEPFTNVRPDPLFNHVLSNTEDFVPDDIDGQSSPLVRVHQDKGSDITMAISNVFIGVTHFCQCRRCQQYPEDDIVRCCHTVRNSITKDALRTTGKWFNAKTPTSILMETYERVIYHGEARHKSKRQRIMFSRRGACFRRLNKKKHLIYNRHSVE